MANTDDEAFSTLMTSLDARLAVVTTAVDGERAGCVVGFHSQSSIEPERYSVWLSKANHTYRLALRATHLGVHFLTSDDLDLASHFGELTGDEVDKFADVAVSSGPGGVPVLGDCANWLVLRRTALLDEGGDHVCVAGEVVESHTNGPFTPLLFSQASDLTAGHDAEERNSPPTERAASS